MSGLVIAGTHSGCGKTTVTLGILAALKKRGCTVQPFKAGPDFIDAGLHRLITGRPSRNLDLWMCGGDYVAEIFERECADADLAVVEGVMGLFDGDAGTAGLAAHLGLPVVLVVDAYGMAESAAAVVRGFRDQGAERGVTIAGVIFNRVGSERHYQRIKDSIQSVPVLGYLPRDLDFTIPHRHLGLTVAEETPLGGTEIGKLADSVLEHIDIDMIMKGSGVRGQGAGLPRPSLDKNKADVKENLKIGVAYDRAFCFYYEDNFDLLEAAGATIVKFSPLSDSHIPEGIHALYLGGGYPELYAEALSRNGSMLESIRKRSLAGMPVYAECGGFMYLTEGVYDFDTVFHPLAGVFPFKTIMKKGRAHLGYREITLQQGSLAGGAGTVIRGHEFHYSEITDRGQVGIDSYRGSGIGDQQTAFIYSVKDGAGNVLKDEGYRIKNVLGSYIHIHFGSNRAIANNFVQCIKEHHGTYSSGRAR